MWWKLLLVVVCALFVTVLCFEDEEGAKSEELRAGRNSDVEAVRSDADQEKWHAVNTHPDAPSDWIPSEPKESASSADDTEPVTKRRRPGRKRKRRPQNYDDISLDAEDANARLPHRSRTVKRPQRLDQIDNYQWRDEMMAEEPFRPLRNYNRRRLYPKYDEDDAKTTDQPSIPEDIQEDPPAVEKIRDPYTALNQNQETTIRRRPYSKRKQSSNNNEHTDSHNEETVIRRRPYSKRKHPSINNNEDQISNSDETFNENHEITIRRRPYSKRKPSSTNIEQDSNQQPSDSISQSSTGPIDLKALLKQSGGISLSELLQQKNLSLSDLLKGEQHAIRALTRIPDNHEEQEITEASIKLMQNDETDTRYSTGYKRRLPPVKKDYHNNDQLMIDSTANNDSLIAENQNINDKENSFHNEEIPITTERRIFVPSHPKYYTSVDYKPNMKDLNYLKTSTVSLETTTASTTSVVPEQTSESISIISSTVTFSTSENPSIKTKLKNRPRNTLPPTLAKLKNLSKTTMKSITTSETENYPRLSPIPPKAIKINLNDLFGIPKPIIDTPPKIIDNGPIKISVNLETFTEPASSTEKLKDLTAKDEIMEILSDTVSRESLTRLLQSRNMTLDELVQQRERGSSQKHLADIFHNQTKEPEPTGEMIVDQIVKDENSYQDSSLLFDTFPTFEHRPDNKIQSTHYTRESRENQFKETNNNKEMVGKLVPIWRQAYTNNNNNKKLFFEDNELIIKDEARRIEDIENKLVEAVNGALNIDISNHKSYINQNDDDDLSEFYRLPYGVRSAIIASAAIVAISLLIFLTIFIIFKWTQMQRQRLTYTNSFSSSKIKTPILETPYQRRIFGSIVNATLGRKKKLPTISCTEPQSLQEYLWETDRKPFQ